MSYLSINHVGYHHDLVDSRIRKFEGQFGCLDIVSHDHWIGRQYTFFDTLKGNGTMFGFHSIPFPYPDVEIDRNTNMVRHVVLPDIDDELTRIQS